MLLPSGAATWVAVGLNVPLRGAVVQPEALRTEAPSASTLSSKLWLGTVARRG